MNRLTDEQLLEELKNRFTENRESLKELKELNEQLIEVNKKLEESEAMKSHFISNITNEIINPFTSILGLAKNILEVDKENWKKVFSMVALIHTEAFNLDFQLRNIFVAAKIEAGQIQPEIMMVNMDNLIANIMESFRLEARKKYLKLEFKRNRAEGDPLYFNTDPEKIKLILSNLMSNAIKFICERDDSSLLLQVRDYGKGISDEDQKTIFERFKRLDTGINSINRGHGLGLSINKALIDMLNGKIEIKSEIQRGALFKLEFPEIEVNTEGYASDGNEFIFDADSVF
jgi:signal transduction histidine kinase